MFNWRAPLGEMRRAREIGKMVAASEVRQGGRVQLWHPPDGWYAEHAGKMAAILDDATARLEAATGLSLPSETICLVTDEETAEAIQGAAGAAYRNLAVIGFPERCLSSFAQIAEHELAHLVSRSLRGYGTPFRNEGFACLWAARTGTVRSAMGLPVHYHAAWMLGMGIRLSLAETWQRRDYSPELYDLAWSFADFLVAHYGVRGYHEFYASGARNLEDRIAATLGEPGASLERGWWEHIRSSVSVDPRRISRMCRAAGAGCSRAAWLSRAS